MNVDFNWGKQKTLHEARQCEYGNYGTIRILFFLNIFIIFKYNYWFTDLKVLILNELFYKNVKIWLIYLLHLISTALLFLILKNLLASIMMSDTFFNIISINPSFITCYNIFFFKVDQFWLF